MLKRIAYTLSIMLLISTITINAQVWNNSEIAEDYTKDGEKIYSVTLWLWDYVPSEDYLNFIATHYESVMTSAPKLISGLRALNQNIKITYYTNPVFTNTAINYPEDYYAHNENSNNYNNRIIGIKNGMYLMNINSNEWRNELAVNAKNVVDEIGYYSVFSDDCGPEIEVRVDFLPDDYEGVDEWVNDIGQILRIIKNELNGAAILVFNGIYKDIVHSNREFLKITDGSVKEGFIFHLSSGQFLPEQYWKILLNWIIEDTQTDYFVVSAKLKWNPIRITTTEERMFAFTSYLLIKNIHTTYSPQDWGLVTVPDRTLVQYYPEMDIDLGKPLQIYSTIDDYFNSKSGLYEREFEKGKVFVNPTLNPITYNLNTTYSLAIPTGGGVVTDSGTFGGAINYQAVNQLTIPTQSGAIIIKSSANLIKEEQKLNFINIFPNPTTGIFTIEGENIQSIEISNINGQMIYSLDNFKSSDKYQVDLSGQPKGVYFVKINNDLIQTRKIVIQ